MGQNNNDVEQKIVDETESSTFAGLLASWDDAGQSAPTALLTALGVYLLIFHCLSNMPLDTPLLFEIHAIFFNLFVCNPPSSCSSSTGPASTGYSTS